MLRCTYSLTCDKPGCTETMIREGRHEGTTLATLVGDAMRTGWAIGSVVDFCPKHHSFPTRADVNPGG